MQLWGDDRAAAIQVGAIVLFAFVIIAISAYQASVVPNQNKEVEYNHNQRVQSQLQDVEAAVGSMSAAGDGQTVTVDLSTSYPARTIFVNPPRPTGRLQTVGTQNESVNFTIRNAAATNADIADFWNGSARKYSTGAIVYEPDYSVYNQAPKTVVENSLVYNEFSDTTLTTNEQSLFDGNTISLTALRGSFREDGGTASLNVRPVSAGTTSVPVESTGSGNVTISIVTRLSPSTWNDTIDDAGEFHDQSGGHVYQVNGTQVGTLDGASVYRVNFTMEDGETYDLQLASAGVGSLSDGEGTTNASYAVPLADSVTTDEDVNATMTIEVRDQYNNPKSSVEVNASVDGDEGSIVNGTKNTTGDGQVTFTYDAPTDVGSTTTETVNVSFSGDPASSGFNASAPSNLTVDVTVTDTDGGGGGGGTTYNVTFNESSPFNWNASSSQGESVSLVVTEENNTELVDVNFNSRNTSVATVNSSSDGVTNESGSAELILDAVDEGSVDVTVGSGGGVDDTITVSLTDVPDNTPPDAAFTYSPTNPDTTDTVQFDPGSSSDSEDNIDEYRWDFDDDGTVDETTTSSTIVTHSYGDDGTYTVNLTVVDDAGASDTTTTDVTVSNTGPTASFDYSPQSPSTSDTVEFDPGASSDSDGSIDKYEWDFDGDGTVDQTTTSATNVTHSYSDNGTYTVNLTVVDDDGASDNTTTDVTVSNADPTASFDYSPTSPDTTDTVEFDPGASSDSDGSIDEYRWDLDDDGTVEETTTSASNVTFDYADDGTYSVNLTVVDDDGATDTTITDVTVSNADPTASFDYSPQSPSTSDTVEFDPGASSDSDGSIDEYRWDFDGDGTVDQTTTSATNVTHDYADDGTYPVNLTVVDDDGGTGTTITDVSVSNVGPTAAFSFSPSPAVEDEQVTFDASGSSDSDGSIQSYEWDWDDDGTYEGSGETATHSFSSTGTYTVTLRVTDDDGATKTTSTTVRIIGGRTNVAYVTDNSSGAVLQTIDSNGKTTSFDAGSNIARVGPPKADIDGDGQIEIPYVDGSGRINIIDRDNNSEVIQGGTLSPSAKKESIAVGSWNGSGTAVFFVSNSDTTGVYRTTSGGLGSETKVRDFGQDLIGVVGFGDIDDDGATEMVVLDADGKFVVLDDDGSQHQINKPTPASNAGYAVGQVADYDDDGQARIAIVDGSNNVRLIACDFSKSKPCKNADGTTTFSNIVGAKKAPFGAGDLTGDGTPDIVYAENTNSPAELYYLDISGSTVTDSGYVTDANGDRIDVSAHLSKGSSGAASVTPSPESYGDYVGAPRVPTPAQSASSVEGRERRVDELRQRLGERSRVDRRPGVPAVEGVTDRPGTSVFDYRRTLYRHAQMAAARNAVYDKRGHRRDRAVDR